jgi:hypothetical protein
MKIMLRAAVLLTISYTFWGCATVDPKLQLERKTELAIINDTGDSLYSTGGFSENAGKGIAKAIMLSMEEKFGENGIMASIKEGVTGAGVAKVKLFVKSTSSGYRVVYGFGKSKFEIKYRLVLETPESKQLLVYTDEQDDSDMDDVINKVAKKSVKKVMQYYKSAE